MKLRFNPQKFPKAVRDVVEIDYSHKLTSSQKKWLAAFNEAEYGSNPDCIKAITGKNPTQDQKRTAWRSAKRRQRDATAKYTVEFQDTDEHYDSPEDYLIEAIDLNNALKKKP
jgi:hypothetical protein